MVAKGVGNRLLERRSFVMSMGNFEMFADMVRYIGKTVTVFTTSGGISGGGFTGVLAGVDRGVVRLITRIGAAPACPLGSCCDNFDAGCGFGCGGAWGRGNFGGGFGFNNWGNNWNNSWGGGWDAGSILGSVTEIPIHSIAGFTHNAI